ncbi:hypothetical protein SPLC1_S033550 [Arthrospira platensis C1]|nr:hypothetical protein SPLC1_S033550 [Arthrospira platensis C1]
MGVAIAVTLISDSVYSLFGFPVSFLVRFPVPLIVKKY